MVKTSLNVRVEIDTARQIRELLRREASAAQAMGLSATPTFSDITRMLLQRGLAVRLKELQSLVYDKKP